MKMEKLRIPTIIGLFILLISLPLAVILVKQRQILRLGAEGNYPPQNLKITNITSSSFSVIWTTSSQTASFVIWGGSEDNLNQTAPDETGNKSFVHSSTIQGLSPGKTYYFKISTNGNVYDNTQKAWSVKTASLTNANSSSNNARMGGKIVTASGSEASNALVIINIEGAQTLSTLTSQNGNWIINLDSVLTSNLDNYLQLSPNTKVSVTAQAGPQGISTAEFYLGAGQSLPPMILGQNHNFTNISATQGESVPNSEITTPQQTSKKPKFNTEGATSTTSKVVSLDSVEEGEKIFTTKPEFFGKAPPQEQITIKVESESPISETIKVPSNGVWKWTPPTSLPSGVHKVTITYRDEDGVLKSIVRNFIVQAAEANEPAFESTPSASLTPTPQASIMPTSTPSAQKTASPSATPAQPVSGVKTPTLILLSIGLLLFMASGILLFAN